MKTPSPKTIRLQDYKAPAHLVSTVDLHFELGDEFTEVTSRLNLHRNPAGPEAPIELDGEKLELRSVRLNGKFLSPGEYKIGRAHV